MFTLRKTLTGMSGHPKDLLASLCHPLLSEPYQHMERLLFVSFPHPRYLIVPSLQRSGGQTNNSTTPRIPQSLTTPRLRRPAKTPRPNVMLHNHRFSSSPQVCTLQEKQGTSWPGKTPSVFVHRWRLSLTISVHMGSVRGVRDDLLPSPALTSGVTKENLTRGHKVSHKRQLSAAWPQ